MAEEWTPFHLEHWHRQRAYLRMTLTDRALFAVLTQAVDRHGRLELDDVVLGAQLALRPDDAEALMVFAHGCALVDVYEVDGASYGQIVGYEALLSESMRARRDKRGPAKCPGPEVHSNRNAPAQPCAAAGAGTHVRPHVRPEWDGMNEGRSPSMNGDAQAREPAGADAPLARASAPSAPVTTEDLDDQIAKQRAMRQRLRDAEAAEAAAKAAARAAEVEREREVRAELARMAGEASP